MNPPPQRLSSPPDARILLDEVDLTLSACFERRAEFLPTRKAIGSGGWQPTYQELDAAANHQAHALLAQGVAPGDRVVVLMPHGGKLVAGILGVIKAGAIVVVLNPTDTRARLDQVMADAGPKALLTDTQCQELARGLAGPVCPLLCFEDHLSTDPVPRPRVTRSAEDVAVLIYTSGSTGQPKGVMASHRSFLHHVYRSSRGMDIRSEDRMVLLASLGGIQGLATMATALCNGASLYPFPLVEQGAGRLASWMQKHAITVYVSAASIFRQFVRTLEADSSFPHLRVVRIGAESATSEEFALYKRHFADHCVLVHSFSSSETGNMTRLRLTKADFLPEGRMPAGLPAEDVDILLTGEDGHPVSDDEAGEIVIRSRYLSPGYWNHPALTVERFSPCPSGDGSRLYRTGDLGRFTPDRMLCVIGRKDDRIKVRGFSVHLAEVQDVLQQQPEVALAVVCPRTTARGDTEIAAFMVPRDRQVPTSTSLREALQSRLAAHMIPSAMVFLEAFPLTPTGKVDRQRLLADLEMRGAADATAPRSPMEEWLAAMWCRVLDRPSIGVYEHFTDAGGDSLRAVDLITTLSGELGPTLPLEFLLQYATIAQMAEALESGVVKTEREREPWFRWWKATLLPLRKQGSRNPIIFLPGGYASENELLVGAGLLPHLDPERPFHGVRLNLHAPRVLRPSSLRRMARRIARQILALPGDGHPLLIGECQAGALAFEIAQILAGKLKHPPRLILLDPSLPRRVVPGRQPSSSLSHHPPAIARYYQLSRSFRPRPYAGEIHIVCTEEPQRLETCLTWWQSHTQSTCHGHTVAGDHESYLRQHRKGLAKVIDALCGPDA